MMPDDRCSAWAHAALADQPLDPTDALAMLDGRGVDLLSLVHAAGRVRREHFGNRVTVHVLDNVQNGACPEDCGYCGQSKDSSAPIQPYKIKPVDAIVDDARAAQAGGAFRFCMALSGRGPDDRDIEHMAEAIARIKAMGLRTCLSAGLLDDDKARRLRAAGLDRLNHNLNTAESNYEAICTTHTYADRMNTLQAARRAGLGVCSGLIVGMGESHEQIFDVARALRGIDAESVPVNFLLPIEGNRVNDPHSGGRPLSPEYCLRVLCLMRLMLPRAEIRAAAGREAHLRSLQPLALWPANSLFVEGYLLTEGQDAARTLHMILEAGFVPELESPETVPDDLRRLIETGAGPAGDKPVLKTAVSRGPQGFVPSDSVALREKVNG